MKSHTLSAHPPWPYGPWLAPPFLHAPPGLPLALPSPDWVVDSTHRRHLGPPSSPAALTVKHQLPRLTAQELPGTPTGRAAQRTQTHQSFCRQQSMCFRPTHRSRTPKSPRALSLRSSSTSFWLLLSTKEMSKQHRWERPQRPSLQQDRGKRCHDVTVGSGLSPRPVCSRHGRLPPVRPRGGGAFGVEPGKGERSLGTGPGKGHGDPGPTPVSPQVPATVVNGLHTCPT